MPHTAANFSSATWSSNSSSPLRMSQLLLVDDDRIMRAMLSETLQQQGYNTLEAGSGDEGIALLQAHHTSIDAIVLDREMPGMDGMAVVARLKADTRFSAIPIIMLTGTGDADKIQEGIDAGVFYYLIKPAENTVLKSVIESALRERRQKTALLSELNRHDSALKAMQNCQIYLRSLSEAEDTASLLASCFPDPERVVTGLMELLVNALEHGNLGISYEEKHQLLESGTWRAELDRRAALAEHRDKYVDVVYQFKEQSHLVQITDCGEGFDWRRYWHINPARATAGHGRGIARARLMSFERLAYSDKGNRVTVMVPGNVADANSYAW